MLVIQAHVMVEQLVLYNIEKRQGELLPVQNLAVEHILAIVVHVVVTVKSMKVRVKVEVVFLLRQEPLVLKEIIIHVCHQQLVVTGMKTLVHA
jgi:hypothetical protein